MVGRIDLTIVRRGSQELRHLMEASLNISG
jgi:hypothetical protein